jgi:DHA1 family solute carrier family 18 vesicular amine transporter 1/2
MSEQQQDVASSLHSTPSSSLLPLVLFSVFTLDTLLYSIVVPFLPGRVLALGANQSVVGALFASYAVGLLLMTPLAGRLTDRFGGQRILGLGLALQLAATLVFAFGSTLPLLFLARTIQGVAGAIPWTAGLAIIAERYTGGERLRLFTQVFSATGIGTLIGPALGGALYTWRGFEAPFLAIAALILLEVIGALWAFSHLSAAETIPAPASLARKGRRHISRRAPGNALRLLGDRQIIQALVITSAGALLLALLDPTLPVLLTARFGLAPLAIGLVFGGVTVLFILVQNVVTVLLKSYSSGVALFFGLTMGPLALILVAVGATLAHVLVALTLLSFSFAFLLTPALELLTQTAQRLGREERSPDLPVVDADVLPYGSLYADYNIAFAVGMLLGPVLAGIAVTTLGLTIGLAVTGGALFLGYLPLSLGSLLASRPVSREADAESRAAAEVRSPQAAGASIVEKRVVGEVDMLEVVEMVQIIGTEEIVEIEEIEEIEERQWRA